MKRVVLWSTIVLVAVDLRRESLVDKELLGEVQYLERIEGSFSFLSDVDYRTTHAPPASIG